MPAGPKGKKRANPSEDDGVDEDNVDLRSSRSAAASRYGQEVASTSAGGSIASSSRGNKCDKQSTEAGEGAGSTAHVTEQHESEKRDVELQEVKKAYRKLQILFDNLRAIRETEVEARLADVVRESDARQQASRKAVQGYASEIEGLKAENQDLKRQILAQDDISQDNLGANVKRRNGHAEEADGEDDATSPVSRHAKRHPPPDTVPQAEYDALQAELAETRDARDEYSRNQKTAKMQMQQLMAKASDQEARHAAALQRADEERQSALDKIARLEKELDFETQQSRKMLEAVKREGPSANGLAPSSTTVAPSASQQSQMDTLRDFHSITSEMTGISLVKKSPDGIYDLLMSDSKKKRTLHFSLQEETLDRDLPAFTYRPNLQAGRDDVLIALLNDSFKAIIKFEWEQLPNFFRNLWKAMNESKKSGKGT